jgi:hypothetical protein
MTFEEVANGMYNAELLDPQILLSFRFFASEFPVREIRNCILSVSGGLCAYICTSLCK